MAAKQTLNSPIQLAVTQTSSEYPSDKQRDFQPVSISLYTLLDAFTRYGGISSLGEQEGISSSIEDQVHPQFMNRLWIKAGEALTPGFIINVYKDGTELKARKASANDSARIACGVYNGTTTKNIGDLCEIWLGSALVTRVAGLTEGQRYFLANDGLIAPSVTTSGLLSQYIGFGLGPSLLFMQIGPPYKNDAGGISTGVSYVTGR